MRGHTYCESREEARARFGDEYSEGDEETIVLPKTFIEDHASRVLPHGVFIKENKRQVTLSVTQMELREIKSDACHYATFTGVDLQDNASICYAARRTITAINRQFEEA
jgi:hypothetical protein